MKEFKTLLPLTTSHVCSKVGEYHGEIEIRWKINIHWEESFLFKLEPEILRVKGELTNEATDNTIDLKDIDFQFDTDMMEFSTKGSIEIKDCTVYLTDKKIEFQSF